MKACEHVVTPEGATCPRCGSGWRPPSTFDRNRVPGRAPRGFIADMTNDALRYMLLTLRR